MKMVFSPERVGHGHGYYQRWVKSRADVGSSESHELTAVPRTSRLAMRWDNLENTYWDSMGRLAEVGHDKLLTIVAWVRSLLGTTSQIAGC